MPITASSVPGTVEPAVQALASELLRALDDQEGHAGGDHLDRFVDAWDDRSRGLAAVRVLGADVLTPSALRGAPAGGADEAVVRAAVRAYPAPAGHSRGATLWNVRDAALARVLVAAGTDVTAWEGLASPRSPGWLPDGQWLPLAADLSRLACAAHPWADAALRERVAARRRDVARGLARALLRRDLLGAAGLARWLALDRAGDDEPMVEAALGQLEIVGTGDPRVLLQCGIAHRLMTRAPA
ncbi:hypothetical protein AB0I81_35985 [Nonomuraea sp. NPDC050404]|uniref:hypothetical protein n=1 Tax=Nonomuraea sp. NPDC050404 TaxID=3155783 RepID=UPI0033CBF967